MSYSITADEITQREKKYHAKRKRSYAAELFLEMFGIANESRLNFVETETSSINLFGREFLPQKFGIFGLIYFVRLIYNISDLIAQTIAEKAEDDNRGFFKRLAENLRSDRNRLQQLANDVIWGPFNLACLLVNPMISMGLTIAGVTFDTIHTLVVFARDMRHYKELEILQENLQGLNAEKARLDQIIESPNPNVKFADKEQAIIARNKIRKQIQDAKTDIKDFKDYYDLTDKKSSVVGSRLGTLGVVLLFSVGITLTFFPPTAFVGGLMVGAAAVLGGASILHKVWNLGVKLFSSKAAPQPKPVEEIKMHDLSKNNLTKNNLIKNNEKTANNSADNSADNAKLLELVNDKDSKTSTAETFNKIGVTNANDVQFNLDKKMQVEVPIQTAETKKLSADASESEVDQSFPGKSDIELTDLEHTDLDRPEFGSSVSCAF